MTALQILPEGLIARPQAGHNLGNVADDWEAAELWLTGLSIKRKGKASQTDATYGYHMAKIRWYCENVSKITLSRWSSQEAIIFLQFLQKVPKDCIATKGSRQHHPGWTPFRVQPSNSSQADIQRVLHSLFKSWHRQGYIRFIPECLDGADRGNPANVHRAISLDLYDLVLQNIDDEMAQTVCQRMLARRDRFVFSALRGLGLRASELVLARMSAFRLLSVPGTEKTYWVFDVLAETAKGSKARTIPVPVPVFDALRLYRRAFGLPTVPGPEETALLILSPRTMPVLINGIKVKYTKDRQFFQAWTPVRTRQGIYEIVKARLKAAADQLDAKKDDRGAQLRQASPHWLRHTFAKASLLVGQDQRSVAAHLGHASIETVMLYSEQDVLDLIAAKERAQPGSLAMQKQI
ncbi:tyrosine-type recombinase/integrase [Undibacterium sp. SXout7W]|uniref:tyrosine-type recombinase/integrase n=1 Tax=Undibacterium sp. SXout7W TaxID=3413049 RepID=UPI003BF24B6D